MKYDAKSLAKYLGGEVFVRRGIYIDFTGPICHKTTLRSVDIDTNLCRIDEHERFPSEDIYPILKTVEDLGEEDRFSFLDVRGFNPAYEGEEVLEIEDDFTIIYDGERDGMTSFVEPLEAMKLLELNAGARKIYNGEDSPTGYVSIHDNLPCVRWNTKGEYKIPNPPK